MSLPASMRLFAQLVRIDKPAASAVLTLVGVYIAAGVEGLAESRALIAALSMALVVAYSFAFNDLRDVAADRFGKPQRPIAAGKLSERSARILSAGLAVAGLVLAATLGTAIALFALVLIALSALYSYRLKSTVLLGNALVGAMIGSIPVYGAMAVHQVTTGVLAGAALTGLFAFALEVLHTIIDEHGDRAAGLSTVSVRLGRPIALALFLGLAFAVCLAALVPWILGMATSLYALSALLFSVMPVASVITVLAMSRSPRTVGIAATAMRLTSYASFVPLALLRVA